MLKGLQETEELFMEYNLPFYVYLGNPVNIIPHLINEYNISALITDFDPLKIKNKWKTEIVKKISIPFYEVDSHNIVPCFVASKKAEYGAYTIRPKITKRLEYFLDQYPDQPTSNKNKIFKPFKNKWNEIFGSLNVDNEVEEVKWIDPGYQYGNGIFQDFMENKLTYYHLYNNDPVRNYISHLSPYLHFGQISAQHLALTILKNFPRNEGIDAFLEQLIIRKELADNFCYYHTDYDKTTCFPYWAKRSIAEHQDDKREYLYSLNELENALTHDNLWNAAQNEMVYKGKMHNYMRMYWAKKILEWTKNHEEALQYCIYLNNKYELDGRDPNGYAGCVWAIGGVHDRAWKERPVFGKIRYMNYEGCKRKFDIEKYIEYQSDVNKSE